MSLDILIHRNEHVKLELGILLLFSEIQDQKLFDFQLFTSVSGLGCCIRCSSCHFLLDSGEEIDLHLKHDLLFLEIGDSFFFTLNIVDDSIEFLSSGIILKTFTNQLTNINLLLLCEILKLGVQLCHFRFEFVSHLDYSTLHGDQFSDGRLKSSNLFLCTCLLLE